MSKPPVKIQRGLGMSLIGFLVTMALIGLVLSVSFTTFGFAREHSRDGKRIEDIKNIYFGLNEFRLKAGGYPDLGVWMTKHLTCGSQEILRIPSDPRPDFDYVYKFAGTAVNSGCDNRKVYESYNFSFQMEGETELGPAGIYCLQPKQGIVFGLCEY